MTACMEVRPATIGIGLHNADAWGEVKIGRFG
jgi:hypothetical protein